MNESEAAQQRADACRDALQAADRASQGLGIHVIAMGPGSATLAMTVRDDMLNGVGSCHGGVIATLADSAFGYACNSRNETTVASGFDIDFLAAARPGDVLTAVAMEVSRGRRTGLYDVTVCNQQGLPVAVLRGRSYTLKGQALVPGLPADGPI